MFLCDATALDAFRSGKLADYVSIAIETKDAYRFIKAVEEHTSLGIRGMFNHYMYPLFDIKVYNPDTIDFNIKDYKNLGFCGLYVNVRFVRHIPNNGYIDKFFGKAQRAYRQYIKVIYDKVQIDSNKRIILYKFINAVTSEETFGSKVFKILSDGYSRKTDTIRIGPREYPGGIADEFIETKINNHKFKVPKEIEEYLSIRFGDNWQETQADEFIDTEFQFRDGDFSWAEFENHIQYLNLEDYDKNIKTLRSSGLKYRKLQASFNDIRRIIRRTHVRFLMWQKYMPVKEDILRMHSEGKMDELLELFEPYLKQLVFFNKKKMTVYFDRDIFNIAKELLEYEGMQEVADEIESHIPEEHMGPIRIKNYAGEEIKNWH